MTKPKYGSSKNMRHKTLNPKYDTKIHQSLHVSIDVCYPHIWIRGGKSVSGLQLLIKEPIKRNVYERRKGELRIIKGTAI